MGKYWVGFTYDMDLLGESLLGFIMIFWGGLVVAWRRVWPCARLWEHAYPAGAFLFCEEK